MAIPLQVDDPGIDTGYHSRLDGRIASTFAALRQRFRNLANCGQPVRRQGLDIAGFTVF
jgi:hypothetical protein